MTFVPLLRGLAAHGRRLLAAFTALGLVAVTACAQTAVPETVADGIIVPVGRQYLKIQLCASNIVRVASAPDRGFFQHPSRSVLPASGPRPHWRAKTAQGMTTITTADLVVRVVLATGQVSFYDRQGQLLTAEQSGGRELAPAVVQGERTWHVGQQWEAQPGEALYGLGQQQLGLLNLKGYDLELWQHNGTIVIPFLVSSRGYGILWDNPAYSRFGDLRPFTAIPARQLLTRDGQPGGLTAGYYRGAHFEQLAAQRVDASVAIELPDAVNNKNQMISPALPSRGDISVRWEGAVMPAETGDYQFQAFSASGLKLWVNDELVMDHWRQGWLPWFDVAKVPLTAGVPCHLKLEWSKDQAPATVRLRWKTPNPSAATALWSEVGDGVDYYFVHGPEPEQIIAGYRQLTGDAPLMPRWAYGLWQCRERYQTAQEITNVLAGFRDRGIPLDNIVQDWQYWKLDTWGSHQFDPTRYPDPAGWLRTIHEDYHSHLMVSVWGKFYPGTANFAALHQRGFLYEGPLQRHMKDWLGFDYTFYDPFNPAAGRMFWSQINHDLFQLGVDGWWMDASEPDIEQPYPTLEGQRELANPSGGQTGARELNGYALANSRTIYEGQRETAPGQRVFILTRSAFAGQQHYAGAVWSGDVTATWTALRKQIPAGLGFALSGMPYWTTDIGGFAVPDRFSQDPMPPADQAEWRELNTRWFEFGTFSPIFRVHGQFPYREMWNVAPTNHPAYQAELKFDRLRYRLLPYIYSLAGAVTHEQSTIMRPLVMDFRTDPKVGDLKDQFLFGPALLVSPITTYQARERTVYLPTTPGGWFDFWTGENLEGGTGLRVAAPLDSLPVQVRAGSIIPLGPELQYTSEKPADPITLWVYGGADGAFTLYEDDGQTYAYEQGHCSRIPLHWDDRHQTLTIGRRAGTFAGLLSERTFQVVRVRAQHPVPFAFDAVPERTIPYHGKAMVIHF